MQSKNHSTLERAMYLGFGGLLSIVIISGIILSAARVHSVEPAENSTRTTTPPLSCSMSSNGSSTHVATLQNNIYSGNNVDYQNGIGDTTLTVFCNDDDGFSIYAVGYTGDTTEGGNNDKLVGNSTNLMINSKVYTSGDTASNWAMKVSKVTDTAVAYNPANMTITNSFDSWHTVPTGYTKVAEYKASAGSSATDDTLGGKVTTTYAAYISPTQPADIYSGQVRYIMIHPAGSLGTDITYYANNGSGDSYTEFVPAGDSVDIGHSFTYSGYKIVGWNTMPDGTGTTYANGVEYWGAEGTRDTLELYAQWELMTLYDMVAVQSKGTQAVGGLQANITTDNSGVFKYDSSVFGAASDAASNYDIYYYRGILDSDLDGTSSTYGSNGNSAYAPNYVKLGNTCWRIVRTTGSGGVKMIYNGEWTGSTCANATTAAQLTTKAFNSTSNIGHRSIIAVGYTFNANYSNTTDDTAYGTLFGTNESYAGNNTDSTIKDYLENEWFNSAGGIGAYEGMLEPSAGYCNDRSLYSSVSSESVAVSDNFSIATPYTTATSGVIPYYFGGSMRNFSTAQSPSLACPRNTADLYTTSSAVDGNGQLNKPVALLTADEVSFAGSGRVTASHGLAYHVNSYLRSGSYFWTFSPYDRNEDGNTSGLTLYPDGYISDYGVSNALGVRPVVSLNHNIIPSSGSGIATDPWVITAPSTAIIYHANRGDGVDETYTDVVEASSSTTIGYSFVNGDRTIVDWNTEPDGSGISYSDGQSFTAGLASVTLNLYAQWSGDILYDKVHELVKLDSNNNELTQSATDLQATITTANSGVYKYDASVFGTSSDAANDYNIYYYRGIIDSSFSSTNGYGTTGDGVLYPNYVVLDNDGVKDTSSTCWRIVRTTGSGGVKMIYNGLWTGRTCANGVSAASAKTSNNTAGTVAFNGDASTNQQIVRVGYTYNSTYAENIAHTVTIADVFGSDSNSSVNSTDSNIKDYIENDWYESAIGDYTSLLEPSAGYCSDRTLYNYSGPYSVRPDSQNIVTYGTSGLAVFRFGASVRSNVTLANNGNKTVTLSCYRGTADVYSVAGSSTGNGQLSKPVALLTSDEVSFAGSGRSTNDQGSTYSSSSYLRSGTSFWFLSPYLRDSSGKAYMANLVGGGNLAYNPVNSVYHIRPAISLKHNVFVASGAGTAADPWIVVKP